jgi:hypothetical protein
MTIRDAIIEQIRLLSLPSEQLDYEKSVPIADVPAELICGFCDDLYHPKNPELLSQFNEDELKDLAHLYGVLVEASAIEAPSVNELLKHEKWHTVIALAKRMATRIR